MFAISEADAAANRAAFELRRVRQVGGVERRRRSGRQARRRLKPAKPARIDGTVLRLSTDELVRLAPRNPPPDDVAII